jgi:hypothetical protein
MLSALNVVLACWICFEAKMKIKIKMENTFSDFD